MAGRERTAAAGWMAGLGARFGIYLLLAALAVFAAVATPEFLRAENLVNVVNQSAALALLAIGQTFVIAAGLIDLSVGQLLGLVAVIICDFMGGAPGQAAPAIAIALALGLGIGLANGLLNNWLRIHPLILTFGMLSVLQGAIFSYTDKSVGQASPGILWLANGTVGGVPFALLLVGAVALGAHYLLQGTRFGLHLRATGASEESARRAGIRVRRIALAAYLISGLSAGAAGIIVAGRLGTGYPNAGGGFELDAIVAVVLGGTSFAGGRGTIAGTLAAVLVLGLISNLLNLMEISAFVQMTVKGAIVVAAILVNQPRRATA
jgi:ribose/xylose/arabinose/galactoside ABC-type transport system permease subunit